MLALDAGVGSLFDRQLDPDHLRLAESGSGVGIGVEVRGRLAGFVVALRPGLATHDDRYRYFDDRFSDFLFVERIAVAHTHRRQGVGSLLYAELSRRGDTAVLATAVSTSPDHAAAKLFHDRAGFRIVTCGRAAASSYFMTLPVPLSGDGRLEESS